MLANDGDVDLIHFKVSFDVLWENALIFSPAPKKTNLLISLHNV